MEVKRRAEEKGTKVFRGKEIKEAGRQGKEEKQKKTEKKWIL